MAMTAVLQTAINSAGPYDQCVPIQGTAFVESAAGEAAPCRWTDAMARGRVEYNLEITMALRYVENIARLVLSNPL